MVSPIIIEATLVGDTIELPPMRIIVKRPITQPEAPALGTVYALSTTSLGVPLDRPATGPTQIDEYVLERRPYATTSFTEVARGLSIFGANNVYTDTGLTAGTQYEYRCKAVDTTARESEWCAPAFGTTASTTEIYAPINVSATSIAGGIRVSWNAPTSGLTPDSYEIQRTYAADGVWSVKAAQTGTTYDDTDVASGVQKWYRVVSLSGAARSAESSVVTASGGSGTGTLIRFAPGHYIRPGLGDTLSSVLTKISTYDSRVKGVILLRYWKDIETSKGVYDWAFHDAVYDACVAAGKTLCLRVQDRKFGTTDPKGAVPAYLETEGLTYYRLLSSTAAGAALWRPAAMDYLITLYKRILDRYGASETLVGVAGEESIYGQIQAINPDYSASGCVAQEIRRMQELRAYAPAVPYWLYTNWFTGDNASKTAMLSWFAAARADKGVFVNGGPDSRETYSNQTDGDAVRAGTLGGIDHRGVYLMLGSTENNEWEAGATAAQIYASAVTNNRANIMSWSTNPAQWLSDAYSYIATNPAVTAVPSAMTGLVTEL